MKIASVAINTNIKELDKIYDYIVPVELEELISRGMRVIVPFGNGNKKLEAVVLSLDESETYENINLKHIDEIADYEIIINDEMLDLANYIKNKYICTTYEALKLVIPTTTILKRDTQIKLIKRDKDLANKYELLNHIEENFISIKKVENRIGKKINNSTLLKLKKLGIIEVKENISNGIKAKTEKVYFLINKDKALDFVINNKNKTLEKQCIVLRELIKDDKAFTIKEIIDRANVTKAVVKSLVEKGLLGESTVEVYRNPFDRNYYHSKVELNEEQSNAVKVILESHTNGNNVTLIHGVTGSGKTEVYLELIERMINEGYGAIVLVPEISLTPQTVERFKGRLGDKIAVLHSRLSDGERFDEWRRIYRGEVNIVIGARSAIFAPVRNLKLIIIDEEHEHTYKSEITPKYDAKDVAEFRISQMDGILVLGSATPSIESYYKAKNGQFNLVEILNRANNSILPEVNIIDMREELKNGNRNIFSQQLVEEIRNNLELKNQIILFMNRRGYSTFVSCRSCGFVAKCRDCDVTLTYHYYNNRLSCHYCGREYNVPNTCPKCGSKYIKYFGAGTEKIEEEINNLFPAAKVLRMDMDTTRKKGAHENIYKQFKNGEADILIGTQMIAKGMDFKNVTLVGIISADTSLNLPDYRSAERTFQLISQVSGRAGRGEKIGKVIIQTYEPDNPILNFAKEHDFISFYNYEIQMRRMMNNPPYTDILYVLLTSSNENELIKFSHEIKNILDRDYKNELLILGPSPCHISKIKNTFRWNIIFKGDVKLYYNKIYELFNYILKNKPIAFSMDINPVNML
ncbi:Primosomal protein N' [Caloramator mitchellensis]|uniref:Replication restart protein PriA n=1 Tax=Caloramator mitchellensis TaxID=908809 RepID=A0A0R3JTS8_CALMK|nr:primosomal protein N' [Caloramator mitchellensis]KRQ86923.1 Primosomal protein N' [Caloramator mitchellensis]